jgi:hypothetical protein
MSALQIGPKERLAIAKLELLATANPIDPQRAIAAAARDEAAYRDMMEGMTVFLPVGYAVTYSHENQPCGLCHHISISVDRANMAPSPEAVEMILKEFGMKPLMSRETANVWLESISPTLQAVNIVQMVVA